MDKLLSEFKGNDVEVYLDDIVIHSKTIGEHIKLVKKVFKILEENNLYVNIKKLQLCKSEIKLLGIHVDGKTQKFVKES